MNRLSFRSRVRGTWFGGRRRLSDILPIRCSVLKGSSFPNSRNMQIFSRFLYSANLFISRPESFDWLWRTEYDPLTVWKVCTSVPPSRALTSWRGLFTAVFGMLTGLKRKLIPQGECIYAESPESFWAIRRCGPRDWAPGNRSNVLL